MADSGIETPLLDFIRAFNEENGRAPNLGEILLWREAVASVRMSREAEGDAGSAS